MGRLKELEKLINKIAPIYGNIHLLPRTLPFYQDTLLRGSMRFARRTGSTLAVINPDMVIPIASDVTALQQSIDLTYLTQWLSIGSIISIGPGFEYNLIDDIIASDNRILLQYPLASSHTNSEKVLLYATPIYISSPTNINTNDVFVHSNYFMVNGDKISLLRNSNLLNSVLDITVDLVEYLGDSGDPNYPFSYHLVIQERLPMNLGLDTPIYLRAYPAYRSQQIYYPTNPIGNNALGPSLIDYMSGMLNDEDPVGEVMSINASTSAGTYLIGSAISSQTLPKNTPIAKTMIPSDFLLFWTLIKGNLQYGADTKVRTKCVDGQFAINTEIIPNIPSGLQWSVAIDSDAVATVRIKWNKSGSFYDYPIIVGSQNIVVGPPSTDPIIDQIEIVIISSVADAELKWGNWLSTETVNTFQFNLVSYATREAEWQSTGPILKSYFLTLDYVKLRYDNKQNYDGGSLYL